MTDPACKVRDIAYVRLAVPDLDAMESFLGDFGLVRSARTGDALYMRGTGAAHHAHISEQRDAAGLVGFGLVASKASDLDALAKVPGASPVHDIDEPGGGRRVTITDPFGLRVDLVHGIGELAPLATADSLPLNLGGRVERRGAVKRIGKGPSRVMRIGHVAVAVADPDAAFDWYHARFGIVKSDSLAIDGFTLAHFSRCDRGDVPADHHTLAIVRSFDGTTSLNHASFEVVDLDDIWTGHDHLRAAGRRHEWGIGRHTYGSQIFDYWRDPWGQIHEHYTDGDLLDASAEAGVVDIEYSQWGPQMPPGFGQPPMD